MQETSIEGEQDGMGSVHMFVEPVLWLGGEQQIYMFQRKT